MTSEPAPTAVPSVVLPSGRTVTVDDRLCFNEASDLLMAQGGDSPLQLLAIAAEDAWVEGRPCFTVARKEAVHPSAVLTALFVGSPTLLVNEAGAEEAHDRFMEAGAYPVPVPIGGGRFVLHLFEHLSMEAMDAFLGWQEARWAREMAFLDLELQAYDVPSAQA